MCIERLIRCKVDKAFFPAAHGQQRNGPLLTVNCKSQKHKRDRIVYNRAVPVHSVNPYLLNRAVPVHSVNPYLLNRAVPVHSVNPYLLNRAVPVHSVNSYLLNRAVPVHSVNPDQSLYCCCSASTLQTHRLF